MRNLIRKKKGGLVSNVIVGVGALTIGVIVILVVVSTILNANLMKSSSWTYVYNESVLLNSSAGKTVLAQFNSHVSNHDYTIIYVMNGTGAPVTLPVANYTFTAATGEITNGTVTIYNTANVTYKYHQTTGLEDTTYGLGENMSSGINNVSKQLPTILLIASVVLLLGVLVFLVAKSRQMNISSGSGSLGGGSSKSSGGFGGEHSSSVGGVGGNL